MTLQTKVDVMSRILNTAILSVAGLALSTAASAGDYGQTYHPSETSYSQSSYSQSSYGGEMSQYEASARYGSGSISNTYTDGNVEMYGFSGSLPGLGQNESLQATNCPTTVYNPNQGRVLGCYNVVKPAPKTTTYYRVVRPVIYVRYPVCSTGCGPVLPPPPPRRPCCIAPPPPPKPCCIAPPPPRPCYSGCAPAHIGASRYGSYN